MTEFADAYDINGPQCPPATQDIAINLKNRKNAIDTAMYGPLNPAEPNEEYWNAIGAEWGVDADTAKKQRCGNCAVFIQTPEMLSCIEGGLTDNADEFDSINEAGELGYCEAFDFKCASARTCRAWVAGGPVTAAAKTVSQTPAPKKDQVKGSDKNKKGSASGSKKITFDAKTETTLKNKVEEHNKNASKGRGATLSMLKAVYRRGAGAFSVSHRPGMTRNQWAMGRVNAFLRLLKSGKPARSAYKQDNDLLPASHPRSTKKSTSAMTASGLIPEEQALAEALVWVTSKYGKFDQDGDGVWAGYTPAYDNDKKDIGVKCSNCVFFQGTECKIISLEIEADGKCRFAVIPEGVVDVSTVPLRNEEDMELLLADAYANSQLFTELKPEEEYDSPEEAIFSMTEFSGLGYEAEQAFRASWLRALRNNDNPYKRASLLATMTYDALDSDLLPTREVN
jgi:hypothetical protein